LLLLLGLVRFAMATDYDLTIDPLSKALLNAKTLTIYDQFGLVKPGDRIVSITSGPLPVPNMSCKVYAGTGEGSTVLTPKGTLRNFNGEIRIGVGNPGSAAVVGALLMHTVPLPVEAKKSVIIRKVGGFLESYPYLWIFLGLGILVTIGVAYYRINTQPAGSIPVYGKRAYEENIRDIRVRLEHITAAQEELVKKPPVLRSFRKQIERFDHRLDNLESASSASQHTASEIRKSLEGIAAQEKSSIASLDQIGASVEAKAQESKRITDSLREEAKANTARLESLANSLASQLAEQSQRGDAQAQAISAESGERLASLAAQLTDQSKRGDEQSQALASETASRLEALSKTVAAQLAEQTQRNEIHGKALAAEVAALQQRLAESDHRIGELKSELSQAMQMSAEQSAEVAGKVESLEKLMPEAVGNLGNKIADLQKQSHESISGKLDKLVEVPAHLTSLHEQTDSLRAALDAISGSIEAGVQHAAEIREDLKESMSGESSQVARIQELLGALESNVSNLQAQVAGSQEAAAANGKALVGLSGHIETLKSGVATREQVESVAKMEQSMGASLEKLASAGLGKDDLKAILSAHDKLGSLPAELSQMLQKSLEQKLAGLVAQSLTAKKGDKDSKTSDEGTSILTEVAKQLLAEIEHQKALEAAFGELRARLESVPESIARLEGKLDQPVVSESPASSTPDFGLVLGDIKSRLEAIPEAVELLARRVEAAAGSGEPVNVSAAPPAELVSLLEEARNSAKAVPERLDRFDARFDAVSAQWEQASKRLDETLQLVSGLNSRSASLEAEIAAERKERASAPKPAKAVQSQPVAIEPQAALEEVHLEPAVAELPVTHEVPPANEAPVAEELEEPIPAYETAHLEIQAETAPETEILTAEILAEEESGEPIPSYETVHLEISSETPIEVEPETVEVEPEEEQVAAVHEIPELEVHAAPAEEEGLPAVVTNTVYSIRHGEQEWGFAGGFAGTWQVSSAKPLAYDPDTSKELKPMTPTETPGIDYEIGAMLFIKDRILYAHGDSIHSFWPGQAERSLMLSHTVPEDPWRLLVLEDTLFCVQEHRVETIDIAGWSRSAAFAGEYLHHCATRKHWAGIQTVKAGLALEFRDPMGELVGEIHTLPESMREVSYLVSDGEAVYVGSENGEIICATPENMEQLRAASDGKLINLLISQHGPVALNLIPEGIEVLRYDSKGKLAAEMKMPAAEVSGNMTVLGDRLFYFVPSGSSLRSCDLVKMTPSASIEVPNMQELRRMIALDAGGVQSLLIAGCDAAGKLGTVFLLDPNSHQHINLCSTNQPHVDAIFANGCPVVATSSSYQNIIRVFQPFVRAHAKAA
jgi:chromosome segregation ATPase